uniref:Uncharacterized protein n=1 Tax=Meloidogyne hapla TaxID=6305 RepID=A0A1I8BX33_MELHA
MNSAIIIDISENDVNLEDQQKCEKIENGSKRYFNEDLVKFYHNNKNPCPLSIQLQKENYPNCMKNILYEAVLEISVPTAKIRSKKFCAESRTSNDAELCVAVIVLEELFKLDIIKEASIELYCKGRKVCIF